MPIQNTTDKRYLTKSRFKLAVECPTKLYYQSRESLYRNCKKEDSFMEALAEGGFQVGAMAKLIYPDGVEVRERDNENAIKRTHDLLFKNNCITLFEPAFEFENLLARVDILVKSGNQIELIEVKAKSYNSITPKVVDKKGQILGSMRPYIEDIAFQKYVVTNALSGIKVSCFMLMPDKSVSAAVDGLNQCFKINKKNVADIKPGPEAKAKTHLCRSMLAKVPVDEYVEIVMSTPLQYPGASGNEQDKLPLVAKKWADSYSAGIKIKPVLHKNCGNCEFKEFDKGEFKSGYHECLYESTNLTAADIEEGIVFDIWNARNKDDLIRRGRIRFDQITEGDISIKNDKKGLSTSQRQWLQIRGIKPEDDKGGFYFDSNYMREQMDVWNYPLHMIDFETCAVALPFFKGFRPYEAIAFQFSHHIVYEDGGVEHKDQTLIAKPGEFPNFAFVRELKKALEVDKGSIFRWATHENTILRQIKDQMLTSEHPLEDQSDLIEFIEEITGLGERSMIDLNEIALRAFFHPMTKGRTSIKKTLPAVMTSSQFLKEKYSRPIYGTEIRSLNYPAGFVWYEETDGVLKDPYERLKFLSKDMLGLGDRDQHHTDDQFIAEGGAAAMAYARLQFEDLEEAERKRIERALLRYCELDTFAMVMIVEAWKKWARDF